MPDFPMYVVTDEGDVVSFHYGKRRVMKLSQIKKYRTSEKRYPYVKLQIPGGKSKEKKTCSLPRLVLSAKLGRWLEPWEHARHKDGDSMNNRPDNLLPGCLVLNAIDELELGRQHSSPAYIRQAIDRLVGLLNEGPTEVS